MEIDVTKKENICIGLLVEIVAEEDRATQDLTRGYVKEITTKGNKAKNITVVLTSGEMGVVKHIVTKAELKLENFKFYNRFFFDDKIYSVWDKKNKKYVIIDHVNNTSGKNEQVAFLFNDTKIAQDVLKKLNNKEYMLRTINRNKTIVENFKTLDVQYFSINKNRKLSYERIIEWESYFKNMR